MQNSGIPINDLIHFLQSRGFNQTEFLHTHIGFEHEDGRTTQFISMDIVPPFVVCSCLDQAEIDIDDFEAFIERI